MKLIVFNNGNIDNTDEKIIYYNDCKNNFGDNLFFWILKKKFNHINFSFTKDTNFNLLGIGSLLQDCPDNYNGYIWACGYIYPTKYLKLDNILAIRGKLSLEYIITNKDKNKIILGDGGLIASKIYYPIIEKKYKLGIIPHYTDILELLNYNIVNNKDVLLINPCSPVDIVIDNILSCENIITSSLHGVVMCDSYNIPYAIFIAKETKKHYKELQNFFKFKDYYSTFDIDFKNEDFIINNNMNLKEILKYCKFIYKTNIESIKNNLYNSLIDFINLNN